MPPRLRRAGSRTSNATSSSASRASCFPNSGCSHQRTSVTKSGFRLTADTPVVTLLSRRIRCCSILPRSLLPKPTYATNDRACPPNMAYTAGTLGRSDIEVSSIIAEVRYTFLTRAFTHRSSLRSGRRSFVIQMQTTTNDGCCSSFSRKLLSVKSVNSLPGCECRRRHPPCPSLWRGLSRVPLRSTAAAAQVWRRCFANHATAAWGMPSCPPSKMVTRAGPARRRSLISRP